MLYLIIEWLRKLCTKRWWCGTVRCSHWHCV